MRHKKRNNTQLLGLIAIIVLLILVIILWKPFSNESSEQNPLTKNAGNTTVLTNTLINKTAPTRPIIEKSVAQSASSNGTIKPNGMCEDYFMKQSNTLTLDGHTLKVVKIGSNAVQLDLDGSQFLLAKDKSTWKSGFGIELQRNMLLYFGDDDASNSVQLRVGCKSNEDPNDKYVADKGSSICQALLNSCKSQFGI